MDLLQQKYRLFLDVDLRPKISNTVSLLQFLRVAFSLVMPRGQSNLRLIGQKF